MSCGGISYFKLKRAQSAVCFGLAVQYPSTSTFALTHILTNTHFTLLKFQMAKGVPSESIPERKKKKKKLACHIWMQ